MYADKIHASANTRNDRVRGMSAFMLAMSGQTEVRQSLDQSDQIWRELDLLSAWDIEDTNGDS